jgi:hypothetical protein
MPVRDCSEDHSRGGKAMLARLGYVLYWTGCGLAVLVLMGGLAFTYFAPGASTEVALALTAAVATVCWLVGRACKYVLAGE